MVGEEVHHPKYGRGVVKGQLHRGHGLYVAFEGGYRRWVLATEVEPVSPAWPREGQPQRSTTAQAARDARQPPGDGSAVPERTREEAPVSTARETLMLPDSPIYSRRVVEAFRMGIVPDDCVTSLTVGRDTETEHLKEWLAQGGGSALVVGEYGSGKTHLLRHLSLQALEQHYAVASVQLDPNEAPLYKPKRIYREVALSLRYRQADSCRTLGFRDLLRARSAREALRDHRYFRELGDGYATEPQYEELFWEWIEAREDVLRPVDWLADPYGNRYNRFTYVPAIYSHTTTANVVCYLLSGLAWAATHALGLRGLVILLDEAESMDVGATYSQMARGLNLLRGLIRVSNDDESLLQKPLRSGLVYSGRGIGPQIPFLYRRGCGLRFVFGFTPIPLLDEVVELRSTYRLDLKPLAPESLAVLFDWVCEHYSRAYDYEVSPQTRRSLLSTVLARAGNTRSFAKGCVEILDLQRRDSR